MSRVPTRIAILGLLLASGAIGQTTVPHWSTYFGGAADSDVAVVVRRGPGTLVTIAGHTGSNGLATAGAWQTSIAGSVDAFVARFDESQPPAQQLLWCTYLGGSGMELVFDTEVDAQGVITLVGLTTSSSFPIVNGYQPSMKGTSDGFIARLDPSRPAGQQLVYSTFLGGDGDDRICDVEVNGGIVTVAGVTESLNLQNTSGTIGPVFRGGATDAFAARIDPGQAPPQQLQWATYLGGSSNEGGSFSAWQSAGGWNNVWEGNLDRITLVVEPNGSVVVATNSLSSDAPTTPGCFQATHASPGIGEVYFVRLDATASTLLYGTFFGGTSTEFLACMAPHPGGGLVLGGATQSFNMPTTPGCYQAGNQRGFYGNPSDGFVCWIDPAGNGSADLRYATYFGGNGGEDSVLSVAVESSGVVTIGGYCAGGGNFPVTPGCLQSLSNPNELDGMVARLAMDSQGASDLFYSTYIGDTWTVLTGLALDEVGDACLSGATMSPAYPTMHAHQSGLTGWRDAVITHLPLLPGGASRQQLALATPACGTPFVPLYTGMAGAPLAGTTFGITATNAPPGALGALVLGAPATPTPLPPPWGNAQLLVTPVSITVGVADSLGFFRHGIGVPIGTPPGWQFAGQWLFLTNAACPGSGLLAASERLDFTTL